MSLRDSASRTCLLIGEGSLLVRCAEDLLSHGHQILAVASRDKTIRKWAEDRGIRVVEHPRGLIGLSDAKVDWLFSIANLTLIPVEILQLGREAINFHDGPLPKYAGLYATSWALMNGETRHGVTWHRMTREADTGEILKQAVVEIEEDDTALSLNARCYEAGHESFRELLSGLETGTLRPAEQHLPSRTYFSRHKRPAAACTIGWDQRAADIRRFVNALQFGPYPNHLGTAKIWTGSSFWVVSNVEVLDRQSTRTPGTIVDITDAGIQIATRTEDVLVSHAHEIDEPAVRMADLVKKEKLTRGKMFPAMDARAEAAFTAAYGESAKSEPYWVTRLSRMTPFVWPAGLESPDADAHRIALMVRVPETVDPKLPNGVTVSDFLAAAFGCFLARATDNRSFDFFYSDSRMAGMVAGMEALFASCAPLAVLLEPGDSAAEVLGRVYREIQLHRIQGPISLDVALRHDIPGLVPLRQKMRPRLSVHPLDAREFELAVEASGIHRAAVESLFERFPMFLDSLIRASEIPVVRLPILTDVERRELATDRNATSGIYAEKTISAMFEGQVLATPHAVALKFGDKALTYDQLNRRANQLAHHLRELGVQPNTLVGLAIERGLDMVVGLLGILKAGGAYVPLDPSYPKLRAETIIRDTEMSIIVGSRRSLVRHADSALKMVAVDDDPSWRALPLSDPTPGCKLDDLAYVIYTSGSTGQPKGVMVAHRNVANLLAAMDRAIGSPQGTWLAVTSISFDISVIELFWTLCRGASVIVAPGESASASVQRQQSLQFSLAYFAADDAGKGDSYRLLLDGARFADGHGFSAVWTPERHFHAFGGSYPNPAVASAAVAAVTERIQIRAGSVVLPLNDPIRVAEEWSMVDNLSNGRAGISFASGWRREDFVLAPQNYAERKKVMIEGLRAVQALWRGQAVRRAVGDGREIEVGILPKPVQAELPVWITAAGNPETFRLAGELGANVLTHLLGQDIDDLARKIEVYREARRTAGHTTAGHVTVMVHTFVGDDRTSVREIVREPLTEYLRHSLDLIRNEPSAFPTFGPGTDAQPQGMSLADPGFSKSDSDGVLAGAFDRYFETNGMFGSGDDCLRFAQSLMDAGTDEVACLIDFGTAYSETMKSLERLSEVRQRLEVARSHGSFRPLGEVFRSEPITHLQCTPSLAKTILADPDSARHLGSLRVLMLGGEAVPAALVQQARLVSGADIYNMYGPTETTVWSTCDRIPAGELSDAPSIGTPLLNTQVYVVDSNGELVPKGLPGELLIGGAGVARGYRNRPELTPRRFRPNPFAAGRVYVTGDRVRYRADGKLAFLGRLDQQVKVRGFRVELAEVETAMGSHHAVELAAATAQADGQDNRLVGYLTPKAGRAVTAREMRTHLSQSLPDYMIPSVFVILDRMPLTSSGKIDRQRLPEPTWRTGARSPAVPTGDVEKVIAEVWQKTLGIDRVGIHDNFFDLGAHSLHMVDVNAHLKRVLKKELSIIHMYQYPTVSSLAAFLSSDETKPAAVMNGVERGQMRRNALDRRPEKRSPRATELKNA